MNDDEGLPPGWLTDPAATVEAEEVIGPDTPLPPPDELRDEAMRFLRSVYHDSRASEAARIKAAVRVYDANEGDPLEAFVRELGDPEKALAWMRNVAIPALEARVGTKRFGGR